MDPLLTPEETAKLLAISTKQLRNLTHGGYIGYVNIGMGDKRETRRYSPEDIAAFIEARKTVESPPVVEVVRRGSRAKAQSILLLDFEAGPPVAKKRKR